MNLDPDAFSLDPKHPKTKFAFSRIPPVLLSQYRALANAIPENAAVFYQLLIVSELERSIRVPWNPSIERVIGGPWQDVA